MYLGNLALPSALFLRTRNLLESVNVTGDEPACWRFGCFRIWLLSADKKRKPEKLPTNVGSHAATCAEPELFFRRTGELVHQFETQMSKSQTANYSKGKNLRRKVRFLFG